jgi:hypothetical protein
MAALTPLFPNIPLLQKEAVLVAFRGTTGHLEIDFQSVSTGSTITRIICDGVVDAKLTDEFVFSLNGEALIGNDPFGFGYAVEGGTLLADVSQAVHASYRHQLRHYLVISLSDCIQFVSHQPPRYELIP